MMSKLLLITLVLLTLILSPQALAQTEHRNNWQVVVIPNPKVLIKPEHQATFKRVKDVLSAALQTAGYDVFGQSQLGLSDCISELCTAQNEHQLLQQAKRAVQNTSDQTIARINLLLIYDVIISEKNGGWFIRVPAYTLELDNGKQGDHWTGAQRTFSQRAVRHCQGGCLNNWWAQSAASIASDAAHGVIVQLNQRVPVIEYQLVLQDFTPNETHLLEQLIRENDQAHDQGNDQNNKSEYSFALKLNNRSQLLHQLTTRHYRYQSSSSVDFLTRHFDQIAQHSQVATTVLYQQEKRRFTLRRIGMPYMSAYITALVLLLMAGYGLLVERRYRLHQAQMDKFSQAGQPEMAMAYFQKMTTLGWPKKKHWLDLWASWQEALTALEQSCAEAEQLAVDGQYLVAAAQLQAVVETHGVSAAATRLLTKLEQWQQGLVLFYNAKQNLLTESACDPDQVVTQLVEAKNLNPMLAEQIGLLEETAEQARQRRQTANSIEQIKLTMAAGQPYKALALADQVLQAMKATAESGAPLSQPQSHPQSQSKPQSKPQSKYQAKIRAVRADIVEQMTLPDDHIVGQGALQQICFYRGHQLVLGRHGGGHQKFLGLGYKRLSRAGFQNTLSRKDEYFTVSDDGSSNGSWFDGQMMQSQQCYKISDGSVLALGGQRSSVSAGRRLPAKAGSCRLSLHIPSQSPGALVVKPQDDALALLDKALNRANLQTSWPTISEDRQKTWVLPGEAIVMGIDDQGQIDIGCLNGSMAIAELCFAKGLQIKPLVADLPITFDGITVAGEVPVISGVDININGLSMGFSTIKSSAQKS